MANLPWLDDVRERLAKHALPPTYIQRFLGELTDHLEDLKEENMSTEATVLSRLGEPEQIAETAVTAYRRRSFLGRHPTAAFFVFGVTPFVSLFLVLALMVLGTRAVVTIGERLGAISDVPRLTPPGPIELAATGYLFSLLFVLIPAIFTTVAYCKLAKWLGVARTWMVASCAVVAAMSIPCWGATAIDMAGHPGVLCALWIPGLHGWIPPSVIRPLLQLLVPLAIGWWFMRRKHNQSQLQLAS